MRSAVVARWLRNSAPEQIGRMFDVGRSGKRKKFCELSLVYRWENIKLAEITAQWCTEIDQFFCFRSVHSDPQCIQC